jgi:hypothetical protein
MGEETLNKRKFPVGGSTVAVLPQLSTGSGSVHAQDGYPNRSVRLIVPSFDPLKDFDVISALLASWTAMVVTASLPTSAVFLRGDLIAGAQLAGSARIEEQTSTTVLVHCNLRAVFPRFAVPCVWLPQNSLIL